jgi:hypothetical protein
VLEATPAAHPRTIAEVLQLDEEARMTAKRVLSLAGTLPSRGSSRHTVVL